MSTSSFYSVLLGLVLAASGVQRSFSDQPGEIFAADKKPVSTKKGGEKLAAGDVIIAGSITPPLMLEKDETAITHVIEPIGEVSVGFTWD